MQYLKDLGFVIKRKNIGESDRFVTIFSKNNGKIDVVAKGIRKITSRRGSYVELLNLIEFQAVRGLKNYVLTETKLADSFEELKNDLSNIAKVFKACELIDAIMPLGQKHTDVFELMTRALSQMRGERTLVLFQAKLLTLLGYWDKKMPFKNSEHVQQHIEQILERRLKTRGIFEV